MFDIAQTFVAFVFIPKDEGQFARCSVFKEQIRFVYIAQPFSGRNKNIT